MSVWMTLHDVITHPRGDVPHGGLHVALLAPGLTRSLWHHCHGDLDLLVTSHLNLKWHEI